MDPKFNVGDKVVIVDSNGPYGDQYKHLIGREAKVVSRVADLLYGYLYDLDIILPNGIGWHESELEKKKS